MVKNNVLLDSDVIILWLRGEYLKKFQNSHGVQLGDTLIGAASEVYDLKLWTLNKKHYPMLKQLALY
ncbi:MAG: hypothetical protein LH473_07800 [Chitinophagales bacterium]|nr:hypothetical protein [Chitinophagales bacterium]